MNQQPPVLLSLCSITRCSVSTRIHCNHRKGSRNTKELYLCKRCQKSSPWHLVEKYWSRCQEGMLQISESIQFVKIGGNSGYDSPHEARNVKARGADVKQEEQLWSTRSKSHTISHRVFSRSVTECGPSPWCTDCVPLRGKDISNDDEEKRSPGKNACSHGNCCLLTKG